MESKDPSYFGKVIFGEPEPLELAPSGYCGEKVSATCAHGQWHPPECLTEFLPPNFSVEIDCYTTADGFRRIVPRYSFEELINVAAVGGLAVIHGIYGFDKQVDHSYRAMLLIHQHVRGRDYRGTRGMKEHLTRNFDYSRDLYVRRLGRPSYSEWNVLSDDVTQKKHREEEPISITRLTKTGRQAAEEAGYLNPDSKRAIVLGLYQAAKLKPLDVDAQEVLPLVRTALFDIDHAQSAPAEELLDNVTGRLLESIHGHLDEPQNKFDKWFYGPKNSIVKQIAKQRKKPGGELPREEVRQALLHLGWRAYEYVGQCIHALMRTIKNSMPNPLSTEEKQLYEHMHESQPYYGGLPAALLVERMEFLRPAILAIWEDPEEPNHIRVLHRMMSYYAAMAGKRREADRQSKERIQNKSTTASLDARDSDQTALEYTEQNQNDKDATDEEHESSTSYAGTTTFIEDIHSPINLDKDLYQDVLEHICELHGIECANSCGTWDYRLLEVTKQYFRLDVRCECGNADTEITVTIEDFLKYKAELMD